MKKDNIPGYPNFYVSKRGRVGLKSQGRVSRIIKKYNSVRME